MSYLEPVARQYRRVRRSAERSAKRAARLAAEHPGKTAAAVLAGALAARAVSRYSAEKALTAASERMAEMGSSDGSKSVEGSVVRVFVSLGDSYTESQAQRDGMRNALVVGNKESEPLNFEENETGVLRVGSGTAVVLARKGEDLGSLIQEAKLAASRIVAVHVGREPCANQTEKGWRSHEAKVGNLVVTALLSPLDQSEVVLLDADETFFACTLIRDPSAIKGGKVIAECNYFVGGNRLRADAMYACHHKVLAVHRGQFDPGGFDRVFVVSPRAGWLLLAELLHSHGLVRLGGPFDESREVWKVTWNPDAKSTLLVVVSPAHGVDGHLDLFLVHCMLHNLRTGALGCGSDVRFTIGEADARVLAEAAVSPNGPRWTETREMFAPFYASSPYVVLTVGPVAIHGSLKCALGEVQRELDGSDSGAIAAAITKLARVTGGLAGLPGIGTDLAVSLSGESLSVARGAAPERKTDVALIVKRAHGGLGTWDVAHGGAYSVYVPKSAAGFGASRTCSAMKKWV